MSCCGVTIEAHRNADLRKTYGPRSRNYTFSGFSPLMQIRDGTTVLLSITLDATANGSLFAVSGDALVLTIKKTDILSLTNGDDDRILSYDIVLTQGGLEDWFLGGDFIVLDVNDATCEGDSDVTVELGGQSVDVTISGGNIGVGASVLLADLNQAVEDAEQAAEDATVNGGIAGAAAGATAGATAGAAAGTTAGSTAGTAAANVVVAGKANVSGDNTTPDAFRSNIGAAYAVYMPGGTNVSLLLQSAFDAANDGDVLHLIPIAGADVFLSATVTQSKRITVLTQASFGVNGAIAGIEITGQGSVWEGGRFFGNRTAGQIGLRVSASLATVRCVSGELLGKGVHQPSGAGYMNLYDRCRFRNNLTAHLHLEDGVGPRVYNCFGDTDGAWYSGSYASPTDGAIWLQTEGAILVGNDFIHSGGLKVEASSARSIEWLLSVSNYWDSTNSAPGILIKNNQGARYIRGLFFVQEWSATGLKGLRIEGSGDIDGAYFDGCCFHNNVYEAIDLQAGKNISFADTVIAGNNATLPFGFDGPKGYNASSVVVNTPGRVRFKGGEITSTSMRWNTTPEYQIYIGSVVTDLRFSNVDVGGQVTVAKTFREGGATGVSFLNCSGLLGHNRGKATVASGVTSITVNHGLAFTPQDQDVFVTPQTGWGGASQWWIDDVNPTSFKIVVNTAPGLGFEFSWQAWAGDL